MPAGKPDLHQTRPGQPLSTAHHRAPAAHRKPSRQPFRHPHAPTPAGPAVSFHSAHSRLSDLPPPTFSPASAAWTRRHAHETSPCQPTTATKTESSSFAEPSPVLCALPLLEGWRDVD